MLQSTIIFFLFLGPLVFFHELGHFLFARFFGVRVEVFSLGFGPKLLRKKWGDTEYTISLIPLGGYVKMYGDNPLNREEVPQDQRKYAYTYKSKWAKFWIVFGGPLANFILAFVIYFGLVSFGEKVPRAVFGEVKKETLLYDKGFRTADVITKINEKTIFGVDDLNLIDHKIKNISILRNGKKIVLDYQNTAQSFATEYSKVQNFSLRAPIVKSAEGSLYYISATKDINYSFAYENVESAFLDTKTIFLTKINQPLSEVKNLIKVVGDFSKIKLGAETKKMTSDTSSLDEVLFKEKFFLNDLAVDNVALSSPADQAGLQKGDFIISVNDNKLSSFLMMKSIIQNSKTQVKVDVFRKGKILTKTLKPIEKNGQKIIGVTSSILFFPMMVESQSEGFSTALLKAYVRTKDGIVKTFNGFKKLIMGDVSLKQIGGPLTIASVASDSLSVSLAMFFRLMALISINLGLINLFPVPVLDGGHIVMLLVETINRGPLSKNVLLRLQQVGVSLLFLLMFVAIFNDITRFF
ncbi:MAG: RIP metalloprotease RseP [Bacteriovoracaceae bacterium]|jgi:regulator of sigma E protease|nr:RIP metalloprotease RseP [Bacteriovoracaceae bacterium]